ncbi:hypothetical protein V6N13_090105 [Hibiscus sabdariffa]
MSHNSDDENSQSSTFIKRTETNEIGLKGLVVNSEDAAYNLYNDYGHDLGFSVRKGKNRYVFGTKIIRSKDFYCSKQGFKELEDDEGTKKHNKLETRTGCPAMIRFTVQDNQWTVSHFISEHNHELATPSKRHLLRSARSIPTAKANTIDSMVSAGIRPTDVYTYMSNEVRGVENVGFTRRDCYNYVNKHKMMMIEAGDGQSLLNHFKNASSHLGGLNANVEFHALFYRCMQGCESELEFEENWAKMINDHNLQDHSWLNGLYKCREKWSTAFSIDVFSSQIKSSQRAEITNNVLHGISKATTSLTEFVFEFENLVARWRSSEAEKDFQCKNGSITSAIKDSSILTHASKVYTHEIYKQFQKEFLDGIPLIWREVAQNDKTYTFEVRKDENSSRVRTVQFNTNAKKNMHGGNVAELSQWCSKEVEIVFRNRMIRFAYNLITKSQENENTRQLCQKILYEGDMKIEKELAKLCVAKNHELKENETNSKGVRSKNVRRSLIEEISSEDGVILKDCENKSSPILNPPCVRPKGISNARLKGHLERRKPKVSKLPKPKKRKQSTIEEHSNAPTGSIQSSGNFAIPLVMMPPNNIYTSSYNSVQQRIDTPTPTPTSYQELLARIQGHPNFIL